MSLPFFEFADGLQRFGDALQCGYEIVEACYEFLQGHACTFFDGAFFWQPSPA